MIKISNIKISSGSKSACQISIPDGELKLVSISPSKVIMPKSGTSTLTVTMFAKRADITPQAVRKMISEGRLKAEKLGEQYVITESDLKNYLLMK